MDKKDTIQELAHSLKLAGVDRDTALTISLRVRHPDGAEQLMAWIEQNPEATPIEICVKSREIHRATMAEEQAKEIILKEYPELRKAVEVIEADPERSLVQFLSILESFY